MPVMTEPRRFPSSWDIEEHNQSCYIVRTFLGCLNCTKYDAGSVCNKYGEQGSKYHSDSIWNCYGNFGSKYSNDSPWNPYSSSLNKLSNGAKPQLTRSIAYGRAGAPGPMNLAPTSFPRRQTTL